ncbi:hypothetical protein RHGRI_035306 [Rhododendron griersonianum]|uniref:Uncharacterized protein n=1 Tax=Rhododendron griersonianum TaxID=479676 RepID=A0AAV6I4M1_9ERIC|nr:hypothetical protein RHGRI_035306 [Rhododendron griersonianum]
MSLVLAAKYNSRESFGVEFILSLSFTEFGSTSDARPDSGEYWKGVMKDQPCQKHFTDYSLGDQFNLGSLVLLSLSVCLVSFPAPGIFPERHIFDILFESPDPSEQDKRTIIVVDPSGRFGWYSDLLGAGAIEEVCRGFDQWEGTDVH